MIEWGLVSEVELLDMLQDYYLVKGYSVDFIHNKRELGVDLVCTKENEEVVVLAKIDPTQADLGQPPLAKQNHPNATKYIYYYVTEPTAPFISVMKSTFSDFELSNKDETEGIMFTSDNVYIFRFLVKYSSATVRIARIIQNAYTSKTRKKPDVKIDENLFAMLLEAHEGIVQMREITETAITYLRKLLDEHKDFMENPSSERVLAEKVRQATIGFVSRLDEASEKLNRFTKLNSDFVLNYYRGKSVWGGTYNASFLREDLDSGDWSRFTNNEKKRHFYKILDYMVVGFRDFEVYQYGVYEAVGCFLELRNILMLLKKASEISLHSMFAKP